MPLLFDSATNPIYKISQTITDPETKETKR